LIVERRALSTPSQRRCSRGAPDTHSRIRLNVDHDLLRDMCPERVKGHKNRLVGLIEMHLAPAGRVCALGLSKGALLDKLSAVIPATPLL
jgi:hypothetical protein